MISGDILTDIDLKKAVDFHQRHNDPVTLVLHDYPEFNQIKVDSEGRILKIRKGDVQGLDYQYSPPGPKPCSSSSLPQVASDITLAYQQMIDEGVTIRAYVSQGHYWRNIGTPASVSEFYEDLIGPPPRLSKGNHELLSLNKTMKDKRTEGFERVLIHPEAVVEPGVKFSGWACVGKGCLLKTGCQIRGIR